MCLVVSADFEGKTFTDSMLSYALQEKWKIFKVVWLTDKTTRNGTRRVLQDVVTKKSDAILMHSRLGDDGQFFEMIRELGFGKQGTVWIVTEITSHRIKNHQNLPQGLLKITLKRPEKHRDYIIYDNALYDAISLFQLSFEESVKEYFLDSDVEASIIHDKLWRTSKRYLSLFIPSNQ